MKRKILFLILLSALLLCGCAKTSPKATETVTPTVTDAPTTLPEQSTVPPTASSTSPITESEVEQDTEADMDLTGPWHLDSEKNDLTAFQDSFPAYAEFGASMEIKSNGQISWYIGAEGGSGNYTQDGDTLAADIVTDVEQKQITVPFRIISGGETLQLEMEYNGTTVYWSYGDSGETFN